MAGSLARAAVLCAVLAMAPEWVLAAAAVEAQAQAVTVGVLANQGALQRWDAGTARPQGLDVELLQRVADASGVALRFERFTEPQLLWQALRSGQVRLLATSAEPQDAAMPLAYTRPHAQLAMAMLAAASTTSVPAAPDLAGRRLAVVRAEPYATVTQQRFGLAVRTRYDTLAEAALAVALGQADFLPEAQAVLQPLVAQDARLRLLDLPGLPRLPRRWAALLQEAPLVARLDQALAAIEPAALRALQRQHLDSVRPRASAVLPAAGASAAADAPNAGPALPSWRVGYRAADAPYSARNAVGLPEGLGLDVVRAILRRAGVQVAEWVPLEAGREEAALAAGRVDLLMGLPETADRRSRFTLVGPHQSSPLVVVSRERYSMVGLADLAGQRVAAPRSLAVHGSLARLYPGVQWVDCADESQGISMVSRGAVDALLGRLHGMPARLSGQEDPGLRITGLADGLYDDGHLVLLAPPSALAQRLRGAMDQVLREDLVGIEQQWSLRRDDSAVDWPRVRKWVMAATVLVSALLAGWVAHYRLLRREEERTLAAHQRAERYLGFLAHEVRTTLQSVVGALALWRGAGPTAAAPRTAAPTDAAHPMLANPGPESAPDGLAPALAQAAAGTLGQLDGLIDHHRLQARTLGLQRRPESPLAVVRECLDEWTLPAQARGQSLQFNPHGELGGWWLLDAFRLQQVLRNVLSHALRGSRPGVVSVALAVQPSSRGAGWGCWVVAVRDQRPVMDAQARARLFEVDDEGHTLPPDTQPGPSAARGLRLARDLAQAMGGTLVVESAAAHGGNGLILHLDLQVAAWQAEPAAIPPQRVLVLEHSPAYGELLLQALNSQGLQAVLVPTVAAGGDRLAEALQPGQDAFGLVLCDSHLVDGELADLLVLGRERRAQGLAMPPVIGMAGDFDTADIERLSGLGALDLLTKDSDVADLVRRMLRSWAGAPGR